jgi:hypothetical protein
VLPPQGARRRRRRGWEMVINDITRRRGRFMNRTSLQQGWSWRMEGGKTRSPTELHWHLPAASQVEDTVGSWKLIEVRRTMAVVIQMEGATENRTCKLMHILCGRGCKQLCKPGNKILQPRHQPPRCPSCSFFASYPSRTSYNIHAPVHSQRFLGFLDEIDARHLGHHVNDSTSNLATGWRPDFKSVKRPVGEAHSTPTLLAPGHARPRRNDEAFSQFRRRRGGRGCPPLRHPIANTTTTPSSP